MPVSSFCELYDSNECTNFYILDSSIVPVADRPQGHEGRLLNISSLNGIRAFCTNQG